MMVLYCAMGLDIDGRENKEQRRASHDHDNKNNDEIQGNAMSPCLNQTEHKGEESWRLT